MPRRSPVVRSPVVRRRLSAVALALAGLVPSLPSGAAAQRPIAPAGLVVHHTAAALTRVGRDSVARAAVSADAERLARVAGHAAVGGLVGVAAGCVVAFVGLSASNHTDRSEDGFAYIVYGAAGAATGVVVGTVVGLVRTARRSSPDATAGAPATPSD